MSDDEVIAEDEMVDLGDEIDFDDDALDLADDGLLGEDEEVDPLSHEIE
jgi:hypothetical protein